MLLLHSLLSHTALLCDHILWRLVDSVSLYDYSDCYWQFLSASMGFVSFSFKFIHVLVVFDLDCLLQEVVQHGLPSAAASLSHVSASPPPPVPLFFTCCSSDLMPLYVLPEGSVILLAAASLQI